MVVHSVDGDRLLACLQDGQLAVGSLPSLGHLRRSSKRRHLEDECMSETASAPIRIGVSACLLGEKVRFDGGHKRDPFLVETFGRYVEWVPVCPEVELGLGTPRETLRLVRISNDIRLIMPKTGADHTEAMRAYAARRVRELAKENLSGYILKKLPELRDGTCAGL